VILLTIQDITEYKQGQKIISERETMFRNMANNAPVMIWLTGPDSLCTFADKTFLEFRGIALEEAQGRPWTIGAHSDDEVRILAIYRAAFANKEEFELSYRLRNRDGQDRLVFTKAKPNISAEGAFMGFIGSCV